MVPFAITVTPISCRCLWATRLSGRRTCHDKGTESFSDAMRDMKPTAIIFIPLFLVPLLIIAPIKVAHAAPTWGPAEQGRYIDNLGAEADEADSRWQARAGDGIACASG